MNWTVIYVDSETIVLALCMRHLGGRRCGIFDVTISCVNCALGIV